MTTAKRLTEKEKLAVAVSAEESAGQSCFIPL